MDEGSTLIRGVYRTLDAISVGNGPEQLQKLADIIGAAKRCVSNLDAVEFF